MDLSRTLRAPSTLRAFPEPSLIPTLFRREKGLKPLSLRETTAGMQEVGQRRERLPRGWGEGQGFEQLALILLVAQVGDSAVS
jgi:hypothetical protein